jgi:cell division septation protein DedD
VTEDNVVKGDLEYNDGLGDLLREKERLEFSWVKTLISLLVIIGGIYVGVHFVFKFAKSIIDDSVSVKYSQETPLSVKPKEVPKVEVTTAVTKEIKLVIPKTPETTTGVTKKATPLLHSYKVIAGSYVSKQNAHVLKNKLKAKGFDSFIWTSKNADGQVLYRIQSGAFKTLTLAKSHKHSLSKKGFDTYILKK